MKNSPAASLKGMNFDGIRLDETNGVATITLSRPEKRNALSLDMLQNLIKVLEAVTPKSGVVVLAAEGKVFSAGHDMSEMIDRPDAYYSQLFTTSGQMMRTIHGLAQPVIAKVQGMATAAGCQLVASCDLAVAAESAWFATPGVSIGLFCTTPMVPVSRAVGQKRAMQMLLTGDPISASQAVDWGLINMAVPEDTLDDTVNDLADKILRFSASTIEIGKHAFYAQAELPEQEAYEVATPIMAANAANTDAQEGMGAFLGKREPVWSERS